MRRSTIAALLSVLIVTGAGCAPAVPPAALEHPAAKVVATVLGLRRARSADATAYAQAFEDTTVAGALVDADAAATSSPIPGSDAPYVSAASDTTATVIVRWRGGSPVGSKAEATAFTLRIAGDRWVIVDAVDVVGDLPRPISAR